MKKTILLAAFLLVFAIPYRASADEGSGGRFNRDCYPGNGQFLSLPPFTTGPTWARGEAEGRVVTIVENRHGTDIDRGGAKVEVEFDGKITGANDTDFPNNNGTSTGRVKVTFHWLDTSKTGQIKETVFESGCVAELETAHSANLSVGEFEAEYEGAVENFPGYPGTKKAAVLTLVVQEDAEAGNLGRVEVDISMDLGYTCNENVYANTNGDTDIEFKKMVLHNLDPEDFKINNVGVHGRATFPDQQCGGSISVN